MDSKKFVLLSNALIVFGTCFSLYLTGSLLSFLFLIGLVLVKSNGAKK